MVNYVSPQSNLTTYFKHLTLLQDYYAANINSGIKHIKSSCEKVSECCCSQLPVSVDVQAYLTRKAGRYGHRTFAAFQ